MSKRILIIDDDQALVKMMATFLTSHGYNAAGAFDGEEGIEQVRQQLPDLIILDVQMPRMNGYTFIFELKKIPNAGSVPIVVLTAKEGMAEIFKVEGVKEYVTKPFQTEALLTTIKKYL